MNTTRAVVVVVAALHLASLEIPQAKTSTEVMTTEAALSLLMNKEFLSSFKRLELLVGPKSQVLSVRKQSAGFEVSAITCDDQTSLGYTTGMGVMKAYKQVEMQVSKASSCVRYRFFGAGLEAEVMPVVVFAFAERVYGLKKDDTVSVETR